MINTWYIACYFGKEILKYNFIVMKDNIIMYWKVLVALSRWT